MILIFFEESCFGCLKYTALKYRQATLKEKTLITITMASVNRVDEYIEGCEKPVTQDERRQIIERRVREDQHFDRNLLLTVFGVESVDEIIYN